MESICGEAMADSLICKTFANVPPEPRSGKIGAGGQKSKDMVSAWWYSGRVEAKRSRQLPKALRGLCWLRTKGRTGFRMFDPESES